MAMQRFFIGIIIVLSAAKAIASGNVNFLYGGSVSHIQMSTLALNSLGSTNIIALKNVNTYIKACSTVYYNWIPKVITINRITKIEKLD
jgi:hypothetical protein